MALKDNVLLMDAKTGTIPAEQGTLVMKEFMSGSAVMQLAKYEEMTKPVKEFTYLASGVGAYWVDEGNKIPVSKPTWLKAKIEAKKLGVIIPATKEFLKWTVPAFFNQMRPAIAEAFYTKFDQATLFGNDSPYAAGQSIWENIVASGNKLEENSTGKGLGEESSNIIAMVEDGDGDPNGFITTRRFKQAMRNAVDAKGNSLFTDKTKAAPSTLHGLPVGYVNGKSWDYTKARLITGDWDYARYGILQDIEYEIATEATLDILGEDGQPINLFQRDMFALRATMHVAFMTLKEDAFAALTPKPATP
ncbi:phage major capsid protein [Aneurinibacillus aneurinilyticus]|uniref:Phage capsid-like C-terminal domain-containing protein n=1 Tax=Aneurinibacillus aneurinilyticus ATCC 12856 TaxID=649747 RepID=U1Y6H4_ANEAE|nr:phage major capsid protein [Aneurinibacillus aneurinilyticus]ERI06471.1 hypothetical protein HMPREF0083_05313 [Aneurinibacillus aneurinilyticus ATCC 12856]MED0670636.1 phage major capsid protein [Aneurinibacillus aneurinilyticus]MED0707086.1 phage major capsid protein [Aneurinibacillus aneurinilyticus]MED0732845.1 phage major capsid protein [Aneurinibacillus aneurinilyticus]MED0740385.1 phage major capsid protein [Aneurinibacillus aneurinilyticus]